MFKKIFGGGSHGSSSGGGKVSASTSEKNTTSVINAIQQLNDVSFSNHLLNLQSLFFWHPESSNESKHVFYLELLRHPSIHYCTYYAASARSTTDSMSQVKQSKTTAWMPNATALWMWIGLIGTGKLVGYCCSGMWQNAWSFRKWPA